MLLSVCVVCCAMLAQYVPYSAYSAIPHSVLPAPVRTSRPSSRPRQGATPNPRGSCCTGQQQHFQAVPTLAPCHLALTQPQLHPPLLAFLQVRTFIAENQTQLPSAPAAPPAAAAAAPAKRLTYEARAALAKNSVAKQCLELMARKKTNLAVAADVATAGEMLQLAEATGPHICVFKTHVDIFDRCGWLV